MQTKRARFGFDHELRLEFHGSKISSDDSLLYFRERDEVLGLHDLAGCVLRDPRTVVAKAEWRPGELFPRDGFVVTTLPMDPDWINHFYSQRGTTEQHI